MLRHDFHAFRRHSASAQNVGEEWTDVVKALRPAKGDNQDGVEEWHPVRTIRFCDPRDRFVNDADAATPAITTSEAPRGRFRTVGQFANP